MYEGRYRRNLNRRNLSSVENPTLKRHCVYHVCIRNYVILVWYMKFAYF